MNNKNEKTIVVDVNIYGRTYRAYVKAYNTKSCTVMLHDMTIKVPTEKVSGLPTDTQ